MSAHLPRSVLGGAGQARNESEGIESARLGLWALRHRLVGSIRVQAQDIWSCHHEQGPTGVQSATEFRYR